MGAGKKVGGFVDALKGGAGGTGIANMKFSAGKSVVSSRQDRLTIQRNRTQTKMQSSGGTAMTGVDLANLRNQAVASKARKSMKTTNTKGSHAMVNGSMKKIAQQPARNLKSVKGRAPTPQRRPAPTRKNTSRMSPPKPK